MSKTDQVGSISDEWEKRADGCGRGVWRRLRWGGRCRSRRSCRRRERGALRLFSIVSPKFVSPKFRCPRNSVSPKFPEFVVSPEFVSPEFVSPEFVSPEFLCVPGIPDRSAFHTEEMNEIRYEGRGLMGCIKDQFDKETSSDQRSNLVNVGAAANLEGQTVRGERTSREWIVEKKIAFEPGVSAGHHSYGYTIRSDEGASAFMKATDLRMAATGDPNFLRNLKYIVDSHTVERTLLDRAQVANMDSITVDSDNRFPDPQTLSRRWRTSGFCWVPSASSSPWS